MSQEMIDVTKLLFISVNEFPQDVQAELIHPADIIHDICITIGAENIQSNVRQLVSGVNIDQGNDVLTPNNGLFEYISPDINKDALNNTNMLTDSVPLDSIEQVEECLRDGSIDPEKLLKLLTDFICDGQALRFFTINPDSPKYAILKQNSRSTCLMRPHDP